MKKLIKLDTLEKLFLRELLIGKKTTLSYSRKWAEKDLRGDERRNRLRQFDAEEKVVQNLLEKFR